MVFNAKIPQKIISLLLSILNIFSMFTLNVSLSALAAPSIDFETIVSESSFPVININIENGEAPDKVDKENKKNAVFEITNTNGKGEDISLSTKTSVGEDGSTIVEWPMTIKGRGNSSWTMPTDKKPYNIKFSSKQDLLGMGKSKSWSLIASWVDTSFIRNYITYKLARQLDTNAMDCELVELCINGKYEGLYLLIEKYGIGEYRIETEGDGVDLNEDGEITQYLVETDSRAVENNEPNRFFSGSGNTLTHFVVKEPDEEEIVSETDERFTYITQKIQEIDSAILSVTPETYAQLESSIDISSFIDTYLVNELTKNPDFGYGYQPCYASTFMNIEEGGRLNFGTVWDFDISMARNDYINQEAEGNRDTINADTFLAKDTKWVKELFAVPEFQQRLKERWTEISPIINEIVYQLLPETIDLVRKSAAWDFQTWEAPEARTIQWNYRTPLDYEGETAYITSFLQDRVVWLDTQWMLQDYRSEIDVAWARSEELPSSEAYVLSSSVTYNDLVNNSKMAVAYAENSLVDASAPQSVIELFNAENKQLSILSGIQNVWDGGSGYKADDGSSTAIIKNSMPEYSAVGEYLQDQAPSGTVENQYMGEFADSGKFEYSDGNFYDIYPAGTVFKYNASYYIVTQASGYPLHYGASFGIERLSLGYNDYIDYAPLTADEYESQVTVEYVTGFVLNKDTVNLNVAQRDASSSYAGILGTYESEYIWPVLAPGEKSVFDTISWSSSDEKVVSVEGQSAEPACALVTAKGVGEATVTCTITANGNTFTYTSAVQVASHPYVLPADITAGLYYNSTNLRGQNYAFKKWASFAGGNSNLTLRRFTGYFDLSSSQYNSSLDFVMGTVEKDEITGAGENIYVFVNGKPFYQVVSNTANANKISGFSESNTFNLVQNSSIEPHYSYTNGYTADISSVNQNLRSMLKAGANRIDIFVGQAGEGNTLIRPYVYGVYSSEDEPVTPSVKYTLNNDSATVENNQGVLIYPFENDVIDSSITSAEYGFLSADSQLITENTVNGKYGSLSYTGETFVYTPSKIMEDKETFSYGYRPLSVNDTAGEYDLKTAVITVYPSSCVFYDDTFSNSADVSEGGLSFNGAWSYMEDENLANGTGTYIGNSLENVSISGLKHDDAYFSFKFYGTGFDIISRVSGNEGIIEYTVYNAVQQSDGTWEKGDTYADTVKMTLLDMASTIYQLPVASQYNMPCSNYIVEVKVTWFRSIGSKGNYVFIDGVRLYNMDWEPDLQLQEFRDMVLMGAGLSPDENTNENSISMISGDINISSEGYKDYITDNVLNYAKNEIILKSGSSIAFYYTPPQNAVNTLAIEAKTVANTTARMTVDNGSASYFSDVESMSQSWYSFDSAVSGTDTQIITITNNGTGDLSLTKVKFSKLSTLRAEPVSADGVSVSPETQTLKIGGTCRLSAMVTPQDAADKSVIWSSDNEAVAQVDDKGTVTAISSGQAVITATTVSGGHQATAVITVLKPITITSITLSPDSSSIEAGNTLQMTVSVLPDNAEDKSLVWTSGNDSVATVDSNGLVTTKAAGTAVITAKNNASGITASASITVTAPVVAVTGVSIDNNPWWTNAYKAGETCQMGATVTPSNATNKNVVWSSDNEAVATVSDTGLITFHKAGTIVITVTTVEGNFSSRCTFAVQQGTVTTDVTVSINNGAESVSVVDGGMVTLSASVTPYAALSWSSSDTSIATVNANGIVTANKPGTVIITASATGNAVGSDTIAINVSKRSDVAVTINGSDNVGVDASISLSASVTPGTIYDTGVTWSSGNTNVATVSASGVVTGIAKGTAVITAASVYDTTKTAQKTITVTGEPEVTVQITNANTVQEGNTLTLTGVVQPSGVAQGLTWSVVNGTGQATLNGNILTAVSAGTVTVTATSIYDQTKSASMVVTITSVSTGDKYAVDYNSAQSYTAGSIVYYGDKYYVYSNPWGLASTAGESTPTTGWTVVSTDLSSIPVEQTSSYTAYPMGSVVKIGDNYYTPSQDGSWVSWYNDTARWNQVPAECVAYLPGGSVPQSLSARSFFQRNTSTGFLQSPVYDKYTILNSLREKINK